MPRTFLALVLALIMPLSGCAESGSPEQVADAFAEAYFRRMDQEKAKEYTALGATAMLDKELRDVAQIRKEGYTPAEAHGDVTVRRGEPIKRDQRIRVPFEIIIRSEGAETIRDADIELTHIQGAWKVVRVGLTTREPSAATPNRPSQ